MKNHSFILLGLIPMIILGGYITLAGMISQSSGPIYAGLSIIALSILLIELFRHQEDILSWFQDLFR